jgi:hypothetical protein
MNTQISTADTTAVQTLHEPSRPTTGLPLVFQVMVSVCCGEPAGEWYQQIQRCPDCKENSGFVTSEHYYRDSDIERGHAAFDEQPKIDRVTYYTASAEFRTGYREAFNEYFHAIHGDKHNDDGGRDGEFDRHLDEMPIQASPAYVPSLAEHARNAAVIFILGFIFAAALLAVPSDVDAIWAVIP